MYHPHAFLVSNKDPSPNGASIFRALTQENKLEFKTSLRITSPSQGTSAEQHSICQPMCYCGTPQLIVLDSQVQLVSRPWDPSSLNLSVPTVMWKVPEYGRLYHSSPCFHLVNIWTVQSHSLSGHCIIKAVPFELVSLSLASPTFQILPDSCSPFSLTQQSLEGRENMVYIFIPFSPSTLLTVPKHSK